MNAISLRLSLWFAGVPDALEKRRWIVLLGFTAILLIVGTGVQRLRVDMTVESFFLENDPAKILYNEFRQTFGSDEGVYIVYKALDGDIFSDRSLRAIKNIQDELDQATGSPSESTPLGHILEITTILNAGFLEVQGDLLKSRDFVERLPNTGEEMARLKNQALEHKDYPLFYLSRDTRFGGIWIRTDFGTTPVEGGGEDSDEAILTDSWDAENESMEAGESAVFQTPSMVEYDEFSQAIQEVLTRPDYNRDLEFYPVGNPILMGAFNQILTVEVAGLLAAALGLMMAVLFILFRSVGWVIWPVSIVILTTLLTLGLMGWFGVVMSILISLLFMLILVVGLADSVHILSGYLLFRRDGMEHKAALREAYKKSGMACLLTTITTSIGMLALVVVPIPPIRNFGLAASVSVLLAFVLTIFLLPLLMDLWRPAPGKLTNKATLEKDTILQGMLLLLVPMTTRKPVWVVIGFFLVGSLAVYGMTQITVDSNMVLSLKRGHSLREAYQAVDQTMGGSQNLEVFLNSSEPDTFKDPAVLNAMEEFQATLESSQRKFVTKTASLVNVVKNTFQALNEDRAEMYRIPQERPMLAQTLLLFDSADQEDRKLLATDDYSQARIAVRLQNYGTQEYLPFIGTVQQELDRIFSPLKPAYPGFYARITGGLALMMRTHDYIAWSQIQSFTLAFVVISLILLFVFGSIRTGLLAMVPNAFPILVTFGTMGLLGIPLDADTLLIAPIVIGIAVDDTIHFLSHYRTMIVGGATRQVAISASIKEVGQAIVFTSLILVLGFSILVFSTLQGIAYFGVLTAVAFFSALLADLLLLPALCTLSRS